MPQYEIQGDDIQYVKVYLNPGEKIYGDAGHLVMKTSSTIMQTKMRGGLLGAIKRELTGGSFFVTEFEGPGEAIFAGVFPGKIIQIPLAGNGILAQSHTFLFAEDGVNYDSKMARLTAGLFGGEGIFLAHFYGAGNVFLHSYGGLYVRNLQPGEIIQVEASHLMAMDDGMQYSIQRVGGLRSMLFSHEGLFFVTVQGPGRVWIHTLTIEQLANEIASTVGGFGGLGGQQGGPGISFNF
ncbi:TIGR00266 family protein [Acidianus sulfidivorans JP7]|uniref:TIGR00266 family protein n=1 Tax=Acidianus sulfidivorans JP7 TaxID=619593 RepID=A0A2U9IPP3_9CREN|nr:TIGR00266 family protein [Acidianus sulfidivorans]AWR97944.1 TIGR00266 family protein [Acidianus sulfidivorans JP7]